LSPTTPKDWPKTPWQLITLGQGFSSFGGFLGGMTAFYVYCRRRGIWMLAYVDALIFGFAPAWIVARLGCVFAHDHPGFKSDFLLAVAYPGGSRHDLGLFEFLLAILISSILYALARRRVFVGFYSTLVMFIYAPARFLLDFLRAADRRYLGLTPAQYACVCLLAFAIVLFVRARKHAARAETTASANHLQTRGDQPASQDDDMD
jgi:phosphatidylglycerol:prolipoprotein diacylglycerol transferase